MKFFTLPRGVTLPTTVANLEKSTKDQKTRNQPCYLLYQFQVFLFLIYKRDLENIQRK